MSILEYTIMDVPRGKFDLMVVDGDDRLPVFGKVSTRKASKFSKRRQAVRELIKIVKKSNQTQTEEKRTVVKKLSTPCTDTENAP